MKKHILLFLFFMLIVIGSSNGSTKNTTIQHTLPFTSDGLKSYYSYDENTGTYKINAQFLEKKEFTQSEKNIKPKNFQDYYSTSKYYYPVLDVSIGLQRVTGIIYEGWVESEYPCLFFQINSYDHAGNRIDALLIDHRFTFEVTYWNDFAIDENGNIFIQEYSKNKVSIDDNGNIIKHTTIPKIESHLLKFKINKNGNFELIH
ncbi:hypothetical protein ACGH6R_00675 [Gilliamella sp. CG13]|uniref:hypothetical protein n=1 Tax=Gilliamella sp. CG13 TaxID=3351502 RepID=UPI003985CCCC